MTALMADAMGSHASVPIMPWQDSTVARRVNNKFGVLINHCRMPDMCASNCETSLRFMWPNMSRSRPLRTVLGTPVGVLDDWRMDHVVLCIMANKNVLIDVAHIPPGAISKAIKESKRTRFSITIKGRTTDGNEVHVAMYRLKDGRYQIHRVELFGEWKDEDAEIARRAERHTHNPSRVPIPTTRRREI
jgi:hypothetical protein